jgi:hypothetical protein
VLLGAEPLQAPLLLLEFVISSVRSPELPSRDVGRKEEDGVCDEEGMLFDLDDEGPLRELSKMSSLPPPFRRE